VEASQGELELVKEAITARVGGCCKWDEEEGRRVLSDPELSTYGLNLKRIKNVLIDHVQSTGEIEQRVEKRERWKDEFDY
jgi:hypothetical protein